VRGPLGRTARRPREVGHARLVAHVAGARAIHPASEEFAIEPKIAIPTAEPIVLEKSSDAVTTPRRSQPTSDCELTRTGVATRPNPRPAMNPNPTASMIGVDPPTPRKSPVPTTVRVAPIHAVNRNPNRR
jgi:hypothetical protein